MPSPTLLASFTNFLLGAPSFLPSYGLQDFADTIMHCDFNGGAHFNSTEVVATVEHGKGELDVALVQLEEEQGS